MGDGLAWIGRFKGLARFALAYPMALRFVSRADMESASAPWARVLVFVCIGWADYSCGAFWLVVD